MSSGPWSWSRRARRPGVWLLAPLLAAACKATELTLSDTLKNKKDTTVVTPPDTTWTASITSSTDSVAWPQYLATMTAKKVSGGGQQLSISQVTWSADTNYVSLLPQGSSLQLSLKRVGKIEISAIIDGKSAQKSIVYAMVPTQATVYVIPDTSQLPTGMNRKMLAMRLLGGSGSAGTAVFVPPNAIRWSSSDPAILRVDADGVATGMTPGQATITADIDGLDQHPKAGVTVVSYSEPLNFVNVSSGVSFSCGATSNGSIYCWGKNDLNQLGAASLDLCRSYTTGGGGVTGTKLFRCSQTPVRVNSNVKFVSVSVGSVAACALTDTGAAYCWGGAQSPTPVLVAGGISFRSIDVNDNGAGSDNVCGVSTLNVGYCWGANGAAQLGNGTTTGSSTPVEVGGGIAWQVIRAGPTGCGVSIDGTAYCWGLNDWRQAGAPVDTDLCGATQCVKAPRALSTDLKFSDIGNRGDQSCGLSTTGTAYCWGFLHVGGQAATTPAPIAGATFVTLTSHGLCGLTGDGSVYCWSTTFPFPATRSAQPEFASTSFAARGSNQCALTTASVLWCWDGASATSFWWGVQTAPLGFKDPVRIAGQP